MEDVREFEANELAKVNKQWILADGMPLDEFPELHSHSTLVKYSNLEPEDDKRVEPSSSCKATLVILIKGKIKHKFFRSKNDEEPFKETCLCQEGEMVYYGPGVYHTWEVKSKNTLVITIQFENQAVHKSCS